MQQTKTLIKILQKLGIDDPDTIALFTPTVQFIIWILLGIGVLIGVYEFWERSQRLHYNETYTKIYKIVLASAGGITFLMCATLAFAAIDSPMATSLESLGMYFASPIMILFGVWFLLSIYDYAKQTHTDEGNMIELRRKVLNGILYAFVATVCVLGSGCGNSNPAVNSSVNVNSQNAQNYFDLGYKYYNNGEYEKAVDAYKKYIAENPQNSAAYNNLGGAYFGLSDYANAADAFRRAIELDPQNADAYNNLGLAYANMSNYASAVDAYKKAIEINPQLADAYFNLGNAYANINNYASAVDAYKKAIEINPQNANAYYNLGVAYGELNDIANKIVAYKKAIEINPQYAAAYNNLGVAYGELNDYANAAENFRRATELDPQNADAYYNFGVALVMLNRYDEALQNINRAIELNPSNSDYSAFRDEIINLRNGR